MSQPTSTHNHPGYEHLSVLVRGESPAEAAVYGTNRIDNEARRHKQPGTPGTSGQYPLPAGIHKTPSHDLVSKGGTTIAALTYHNIYVSGDTAWDSTDKQNIDTSLNAVMTEPKLVEIIQQYFPNATVTTTFAGSVDLAVPKPATVSRGDINNLLQDALNAKLITGDFDTSVFNFLLPPGTVLTDDAAASMAEDRVSSLQGLGGYHGSVHIGAQRYYFAVGVYSQDLGGGQQNGIVAFDAPWKSVVATFYHELQEARTDADVEDVNAQLPGATLGWISKQGEEIGDFPVFEDPSLHGVFVEIALAAGGTAPVQLVYSNRAHGPEVPAA